MSNSKFHLLAAFGLLAATLLFAGDTQSGNNRFVMVCKGGPHIRIEVNAAPSMGGIDAHMWMSLFFKKASIPAGPMGLKLKDGQCGLVGARFRSADRAEVSDNTNGAIVATRKFGRSVTFTTVSPYDKLFSRGKVMAFPVERKGNLFFRK